MSSSTGAVEKKRIKGLRQLLGWNRRAYHALSHEENFTIHGTGLLLHKEVKILQGIILTGDPQGFTPQTGLAETLFGIWNPDQ